MNKLLLFFAMTIFFSCSPEHQENIKPNILWLTFEDTSPQYIGCYGNSWAKTPTMDALAEEGVLFNAAFSTGTVCSPSRFTLITGCRTTSYGTGHHRSNYAVPKEIEAFPKYLREAGYYTSNNNKTDYNTSKHKYFTKTAWDESSNKAGWWNRKPGQPFFAVFNSIHSHQSRTMTNPWWKYKEQVLDSLEYDAIVQDTHFEMPPIFRDSPEMRKEHARVYNGIQLTDRHFGRILKRLKAEGLRDSTIIFCFSDHGEGITGGKCHPRAMGYRVPFIIWFPDMYKHLSPWGTNVVTSDVIDFADLPATLLSMAGLDLPDYMEGTALLGNHSKRAKNYTIGGLDRSGENLSLSRSISDGKYIFNKNFMPFQSEVRWQKYFDFAQSAQILRKNFREKKLNKTQSFLLAEKNPETFYNLEKDSWETQNLIDSSQVQDLINEMKSVLIQDLIEKRDAHFIPEYSIKELKISPYDLASDTVFYRAEAVIHTAFLCGDKNALSHHLNGIKHKNDIVRYWAMLGIYTHLKLHGGTLKILDLPEADNYPPADVFLQAIRAQFFKNKKAEEKLLKYLKGNNEDLGLVAAQLLLLEEKIEHSLLERIITNCKESEFGLVKQSGELFEHKYKGVKLHYNNFW